MRAQKWGTLPHAYSGAPGMTAEPRQWYAGKRHVLMFTHKDPNLVLHVGSRTCKLQMPHKTSECGYFSDREKRRSSS